MEYAKMRGRNLLFIFALLALGPSPALADPQPLPALVSTLNATLSSHSRGLAGENLCLAEKGTDKGTLSLGDLSCTGAKRMQCSTMVDNLTLIPTQEDLSYQIATAAFSSSWDWHSLPFDFESVEPSNTSCKRTDLRTGPIWTTSGAWKGDELLLADNLNNSILRFSEEGRFLGSAPEALMREFSISGIRPYGSGYMLSSSGGSIIWIDKDYYPVRRSATFTSVQKPTTISIRSRFDWSFVRPAATKSSGEAEMISFSDVDSTSGITRTGFIRYSAQHPADVTLLAGGDRSGDEAALTFYLLGFPYITSIGSTAYAIDFARGLPRLLKNRGSGDGLVDLNADLGTSRIALPKFEGQKSVVALMQAVEKTTMPVGLYAWEGFLYVLRHTGQAQGPTWTLQKIDPRDGVTVGETTLPLHASHVTVVPGKKIWVFIEKGSVLGFGNQVVQSAYFVPADLIFSMSRRIVLCP